MNRVYKFRFHCGEFADSTEHTICSESIISLISAMDEHMECNLLLNSDAGKYKYVFTYKGYDGRPEWEDHAFLVCVDRGEDTGFYVGYCNFPGENTVRPQRLSYKRVDKELSLNVRASNILSNQKIHTLKDLTDKSPKDLIKMPGMGDSSFKSIREELANIGLHLKGDNKFMESYRIKYSEGRHDDGKVSYR